MVKSETNPTVATGGGHSNHILVGMDPPVLLTTRTAARGACALCSEHRLELNKASYFGTARGSLYAYALCSQCARSTRGGQKRTVLKRRTGCDTSSPDSLGTDATLVYLGAVRLKCAVRDKRKLKFAEMADPGALLMDPAKAKRVCKGPECLGCLDFGRVSQQLAHRLEQLEIGGRRVLLSRGGHKISSVRLDSNLRMELTHCVRSILDQGRIRLAHEGKIRISEAHLLVYEPMQCLREFHWDAKRNTYGNLLIRVGDRAYLGGDTFMQHGRVRFSLEKREAAVWVNYDHSGHLLEDAVHAAGLVYEGCKTVLAALWEIQGFDRPVDINEQAATIASSQSTHHGVRGDKIEFV